MRVLIVDDEVPARAKLRRMLGRFADVEVVAEAADGVEALAMADWLAPDAMFVDVQMPEVDGFDLAASLPDPGPKLVFVTAFDRYALQAFDTCAIDYLLKPVEPSRLERAVERLRIACGDAVRPAAPQPARLLVVERGVTTVVECNDIEWLEAADNYVHVHTPHRKLLLRRTLATLLEDLGPKFLRIHRGIAVAVAQVLTVRPRGKGDATVVLQSGVELACSRRHRGALVARLLR